MTEAREAVETLLACPEAKPTPEELELLRAWYEVNGFEVKTVNGLKEKLGKLKRGISCASLAETVSILEARAPEIVGNVTEGLKKLETNSFVNSVNWRPWGNDYMEGEGCTGCEKVSIWTEVKSGKPGVGIDGKCPFIKR
jgi:hypothetical protein